MTTRTKVGSLSLLVACALLVPLSASAQRVRVEAQGRFAPSHEFRIQVGDRDRHRRFEEGRRNREQRLEEARRASIRRAEDRARAQAAWQAEQDRRRFEYAARERSRREAFQVQVRARREQRMNRFAHNRRWLDANRRVSVELQAGPWVTIDTMYEDQQRIAVRREMRRHARRSAYLSRMRSVALEVNDPQIAARVDELEAREQLRFERRMNALGVATTVYRDPAFVQ